MLHEESSDGVIGTRRGAGIGAPKVGTRGVHGRRCWTPKYVVFSICLVVEFFRSV